jgi:hypothetical protein
MTGYVEVLLYFVIVFDYTTLDDLRDVYSMVLIQ